MRFNDGISLDAAIQLCFALRPKARKAQTRYLAQRYAQIAELQLINKYRFGHTLKYGPLSTAWHEQLDAQRKPEHDMDCQDWSTTIDIMLYPIECPVNGGFVLLGKSSVGQGTFHNLIMRNLPVKDWHYQDSSDRPSHINAATWRLRRKQWEEALPGAGVPIDNGLSIRLGLSNPETPSVLSILRYLRIEDIVERQARRIVVNDRAAAIAAANPTVTGGGFSLKRVMDNHNAAMKYLNSAEGMQAVVEEAYRLGRMLPNPLQKEHLL
jgi:hypothetical protein